MKKPTQCRILERWGEVHVQKRVSFLGIKWWSTVERHYGEMLMGSEPVDFKTVEEAKAYIDKMYAVYHKIYEVPAKITYYPAH